LVWEVEKWLFEAVAVVPTFAVMVLLGTLRPSFEVGRKVVAAATIVENMLAKDVETATPDYSKMELTFGSGMIDVQYGGPQVGKNSFLLHLKVAVAMRHVFGQSFGLWNVHTSSSATCQVSKLLHAVSSQEYVEDRVVSLGLQLS
jgi:hypothetical protein